LNDKIKNKSTIYKRVRDKNYKLKKWGMTLKYLHLKGLP
jgi:hypothetical protein